MKGIAKMAKYTRKTENIDPERGDCLMIYRDKAMALQLMDKKSQSKVLSLLLEWFCGKGRDEVLSKASNLERARRDFLEMLIDNQRATATKFIADCKKKQRKNKTIIGVQDDDDQSSMTRVD